MAITGIPSLFPNAPTETNANTAPVQPTQPLAATDDTVQLTEAERIYQLYNQGQPISHIAQALNLTVDQVNSYLNITNAA